MSTTEPPAVVPVSPAAPAAVPDLAERYARQVALPTALAVTAVYLLVCGPLALNHAMWIDEAQAFLLARDSHSLRELIYNLRYEGHPPLWHLLLYGVTRVFVSYHALQVFHLLLAATTVFLVARWSPLPWAARRTRWGRGPGGRGSADGRWGLSSDSCWRRRGRWWR
jgi:hypothetical protein